MADEVLDFLRVNFARLNERIDRIEADMSEFRERLGHIEGQVAGIYGMYATLSSRMDRMDGAWSVSSAGLIWSKCEAAYSARQFGVTPARGSA